MAAGQPGAVPWSRTRQDASHDSRSQCQGTPGDTSAWQCGITRLHACTCVRLQAQNSVHRCGCVQTPTCPSPHATVSLRWHACHASGSPHGPPGGHAVLAFGREGMLPGDSHMMLFLSFRRVVGSSLGVCGVPRVVEALVESLSKTSMSGDCGELSMRLATNALWYCCRVTWAHRHACPAQRAPSPTGTSRQLNGTKPLDSRSAGLPSTHWAPTRLPGQSRARGCLGRGWLGRDGPCQLRGTLTNCTSQRMCTE